MIEMKREKGEDWSEKKRKKEEDTERPEDNDKKKFAWSRPKMNWDLTQLDSEKKKNTKVILISCVTIERILEVRIRRREDENTR